jgi:hypothetical protein
MYSERTQPLVVVASGTPGEAERVVARLRQAGALAYATHSAEGCLRVATSVRPDVVLIDPRLHARQRLERLLRAHPSSAQARVHPITATERVAVEAKTEVERTAHLVAA